MVKTAFRPEKSIAGSGHRFFASLGLLISCVALPASSAIWFPWSKARIAPEDSAAAAAAAADSVTPVLLEQEKTKFDLYKLRSDKLVKQLWFSTGPRGPFEPGEYQVLATYPDSGPRKAYLLREGTQLAPLSDSVTDAYWFRIRSEGSGLGTGQSLQQTLATGFWRNVWNPNDPIQPFQWPTGLTAGAGISMTAIPSSDVSFMRVYEGTVVARPIPWVVTEFGWHNVRHAGGLRRNLFHEDGDTTFKYFGPAENWWHAAVGVPGLKYEISLADRAFPEFYWLDPKAGEASYKTGNPQSPLVDSMGDGVLLRRWRLDGEPGGVAGNLTHALHAKAGVIRYSAYFDGDLYNSVIQQVMFENLPVPFGLWGFGLTFAENAAHTRLYMDFFPATFGMGPKRWGYSSKLFFLRLDVDLRSSDTFRIGASSRILLDGPVLRPGDKR
jgi:hypothetical protein